jgi:16S rRNA (uracil1498-N3)-methyltransferase
MKQFVLPEDFAGEQTIELSGDDYHYLCTVRRYGVGDTFAALDRDGTRYVAEVTDLRRGRCTVVLMPDGKPCREGAAITLYQSLPKGSKMDQIVRQATEAGVSRIVPVTSEHTISHIEGKVEKKLDRWRRIAQEAVQQSRAPRVPEITAPHPIAGISAGPLTLYFDSDDAGATSLHQRLSEPAASVGVVIGPEGGWSEKDRQTFEHLGISSAFLGPQVLRTETAALYAVASIQIILLEQDQWIIRSE